MNTSNQLTIGKALLCCMLAHGGYNLISFFTAVMPLLDRAKYL
ncbi:hypothetical protein [Eisenbergiella tayi]